MYVFFSSRSKYLIDRSVSDEQKDYHDSVSVGVVTLISGFNFFSVVTWSKYEHTTLYDPHLILIFYIYTFFLLLIIIVMRGATQRQELNT